MLSEQNQKILQDQFNKLPQEIQDVILESKWKESVRKITEKYSLHIDQGGALETLVFLTMLGIEEPESFVRNLRSEVKVTESLANEISKEINDSIFQKIRKAVMEKESKEKIAENSDVEIIDEENKDPYREFVGEENKKTNYIDGQHLDDKSILEDIEDPATEADKDHSDIEIPKEIYNSKDVQIVEDKQDTNDLTDKEGEAALASVLAQKTGVSSEEPKKIDPLHIRTLKSDVMRQKLENPSWSPELDKTFSKNTKSIVEKASAEAGLSAQKPAPATDYQNNTAPTPVAAPAAASKPESDPYRESF